MLNVADGRRNIADDRQYVTLRKVLRAGGDNKPPVPSLIVTHPTLDSFSAFIKGIEDRPERVKIVRSDFLREGSLPRSEAELAVQSSSWTGNPSVEQQAKVVLVVGPRALVAIDVLIAEQDRRFGNGGPISPEERDALNTLKDLRTELDTLIRAAEAGKSMLETSNRLAELGTRAIRSFTENLKQDSGAVHAATSTLAASAITYAIVHSMIGMSEASALVFAGFGATGFITSRKQKESSANPTRT